MLDAVIIGSGPNGLVAAATLARAGLNVVCLEAQGRAGGALGSLPLTEPGFIHDVGAAFFPFAPVSPGLLALDLGGAGLRWARAPLDTAHLAADGSCAALGASRERTARELMPADAETWFGWEDWHAQVGDRFARAILAPLPALREAVELGPRAIRFAPVGLMTSSSFSESSFRSAAAQRIVSGLALHADLGPDDLMGAAVGMTLALLATRCGFAVPVGGAQAITEALLARVRQFHGEVRTSARVERIVIRERAVAAVRLTSGEEIECRGVVADTGAPALCLKLVGEEHLPNGLVQSMRRFAYGWGTFKLDLALDGPVPWRHASCREAAVVHVSGSSMGSMRAFTNAIRDGRLPTEPYALVGQQSVLDPTRAPSGKHTLYIYTHVPSTATGGWGAQREAFADRVADWIEACAPGFKALVRARHILSPVDLEAMNENLVGGDLGGGTAQVERQLFLRPAFPYFRYRLPLKGLYLGSASTHPGTGVHGACGYNAARALLDDRGIALPAPLPSSSALA